MNTGSSQLPISSSLDAEKMADDEISPKTIWAAVLPLVAGLILLVLDKLLLDNEVPDEVWLALLGSGPLAGAGAYKAKPGRVSTQGRKWA